jgi:hypothetical protein
VRTYAYIPTVHGTATGAIALKRVKHKIHEVKKRIELREDDINIFFLKKDLEDLKKQKENIIKTYTICQ